MTDYADLVDELDVLMKFLAPTSVVGSAVVAAKDAITALVKERDDMRLDNARINSEKMDALLRAEAAEAERDFAKAQLAGTNKNIAGWLEARDDNLKRALAAEAQAAKLKEALTKITDYGDGTGCNPRWFIEIARAALEGK